MGNVPGAFIVVDVTTWTVLAAHGMDLASSHLEAPDATLKPFQLMARLEAGKLDRGFCSNPARDLGPTGRKKQAPKCREEYRLSVADVARPQTALSARQEKVCHKLNGCVFARTRSSSRGEDDA